jgi:hypothetical protein
MNDFSEESVFRSGNGEEEEAAGATAYLQQARLSLPADYGNTVNNVCQQSFQLIIDPPVLEYMEGGDSTVGGLGPDHGDLASTNNSMSITNDGTLTTSTVNSTDMFSWRKVPSPSRKRAVVDANANTPEIKRSSRDPRLHRSAIFSNNVNTTPIKTNNRFGVLSSDDSNSPKSSDPEPIKTTRPPPIRLQCELSYIELTTYLTKLVGEGNYRCTSTTQGVSIYPAAP